MSCTRPARRDEYYGAFQLPCRRHHKKSANRHRKARRCCAASSRSSSAYTCFVSPSFSLRTFVVRCMRRMSQPFDLAALNTGFPADRPTDPGYDATVYAADVWIDEDQQVQMQKRASRAEVAPRQREPASSPSTENTPAAQRPQ